MQVLFHDVAPKLPMGNNRPAESLDELLLRADFVTLHVPETPLTRGMIGEGELLRMKPGAYLLNLSRGSVVDVEALARRSAPAAWRAPPSTSSRRSPTATPTTSPPSCAGSPT